MSKYTNFFVTIVTVLAIAIVTSLGIISPAIALTQEFQLDTESGYLIKTIFSYDDTQNPQVIHEQGAGKTQIVNSMRVNFYQPDGELIASYDNIVAGVAKGNYFEFNFELETQQLIGNIDLGGEFAGEMYLKGEAEEELSLIKVEASGTETVIDRAIANYRSQSQLR